MRFASNTATLNPKMSRLTTNLAGGQAYTMTDRLKFISMVLTTFLKDEFYKTGQETVKDIRTMIPLVGYMFAAKTAVYARNVFGMRSVSHLIASEIARNVKGEKWVKEFLSAVVRRPDDVTEILGCYLTFYGKPIPNTLKKGLGAALTRFDAYQVAKYRRTNAPLSLVDAVNLLHPPHTEALAALVKGTLATPETWEAKISEAGSDADKKASEWAALILEEKIGYMALVRNLRNIIQSCGEMPEVILKAKDLLTRESLIRRSLIMPFRFTTAWAEIRKIPGKSAQSVAMSLSAAIDISLKNMPQFEGDTLVVLDVSGSMQGTPAEIGSLFAAALVKGCQADFMTFAADAQYEQLDLTSSLMSMASGIPFTGGGTNFHSIFQRINRPYDRIIILSDMQGWIGAYCPAQAFAQYKSRTRSNPKVFSFDLKGYGTLQFPEQNVVCLAGFSDKTLPLLQKLDVNQHALIEEVESTTWYPITTNQE